MNRYICIHGHFYQPPRENPWLEEVELQESAHPYHDWNERINAECYAPNTASRVYGPDKKIARMVNNYSSISFNFGPTLLSWMERHAPEDYQSILQADKDSQARFSGHGGALAQVYNHMIMPLANARDQRTQVYWGIRDFEHRFKRKPQGMWLAETAVDTATLEILAEYGIKFTILAPHQAAKVRKIGEEKWTDLKDSGIDPQMAYVCPLPSGRKINLFFYDGPVSREVAFTDLLKDGVNFANRLLGVFPHGHHHDHQQDHHRDRLVHIATDGETYGHHHGFGDMALAYCLDHITKHNLARVTVYGEYLARIPPTHEVQIFDNTSWSCIHGVERWRADCGCNIAANGPGKQKWRAPLRQAMDWLRDSLVPLYEEHMREFADQPWQTRDDYIDVVLDRSPENMEDFFHRHCPRQPNPLEKVKFLKLLELQRHAMLMYTSCGWFFDDVGGIEAGQILQYAGRVLQLARQLFGKDLEPRFKKLLEAAPGSNPNLPHAAALYEKYVQPAQIDLAAVVGHSVVSSMFDESHALEEKVYSYALRPDIYERKETQKQMMVAGSCHIRSDITLEEAHVSFAMLHFNGQSLKGGVMAQMPEETFRAMLSDMGKAFARSDMEELSRLIPHYFGDNKYALKYLFKDKQKEVFTRIIHSVMEEFEADLRGIYQHYYPLMQAREELQIVLPKALITSLEFILNRDLLDLLDQDLADIKTIKKIVEEVRRWSFEIDKTKVAFAANRRLYALMQQFRKKPQAIHLLQCINDILEALEPLRLNWDLWRIQHMCLMIGSEISGGQWGPAGPELLRLLRQLRERLNIHNP